jgi:hypothetical protein
MHTNGYEISYIRTTRSKCHVRLEHEPLSYEQTWNTCLNHSSTVSKGCVHQEYKPLNDEQIKNT